ncbi:NADAR family protein [Deinococcus multiflagellatus]|uniref:NADAR family protein n=1 Tax=Deinococcus multiflagellatus TaxID=1656887 RepID=A0ABW1ZMN7_9DEIO|nr:NADAR family protein [Deinococcus multiflagellatus]MBZ9712570.1 NADAR family protein [Deinococcus multiflagellatus]
MSPQTLSFYRTAHPFSNFHPSVFVEEGVTSRWAEQYLMARKARLFGDKATLAQILAAATPAECKALGRRVTPYDEVWARERFAVALDMLRLKFGQNARLRAELLATGGAELVEASPTDRIWGIGFSETQAEGARQAWGQNLLGLALMAVRAELQPA